jgi:DNA-binding CsgD family transcriptional regulator
VFITGHGDVPMAVTTMKKGAMDFIEKPFKEDELLGLVEKMLDQARSAFSQHQEQASRDALLSRLTTREAQVLERIVAGRLNKQIADDLGISIKTVEAHRANIMEKLNANTVADLLKIALGARPQGLDRRPPRKPRPPRAALFANGPRPPERAASTSPREIRLTAQIIDGAAMRARSAPKRPRSPLALAAPACDRAWPSSWSAKTRPAPCTCATRSRPVKRPACTRCSNATTPRWRNPTCWPASPH